MTDAMTADAYIDEALTEWVGPRCPDHHPDCPTCQAWARLDALRAVPQPPQEPTPEAVERAAEALVDFLQVEEGETGWWANLSEDEREDMRRMARAALTAALTAPA